MPQNMVNGKIEVGFEGCVDFKGRRFVRAKTGGWRACSLIVGYEFCERVAFAGIWSSLVVYMTSKLHEGTVSSSINASNWVGTVFITPLLGAYITERYLGRFLALAIFCCIYTLGTGIMTLSVSLKSLRPKQCPINEDCQKASPLQNGIFFLGLYLIALGSGGTRPNICAFGADQFDDSVPKEKQLKNSFFNWWVLIVFSGGLFGQTVIVYIQDKMDWGVGNGIITAALVASCFLLLIRTPVYRHKIEPGRPLQRIVKVICTMFQNWKVPVPADPSSLHEVDSKEYVPEDRYLIAHTTHLSQHTHCS